MYKIRCFVFPILVIFFSGARAVRSIYLEAQTNTHSSSVDIFFAASITIGILTTAFSLKNKYWSTGVVFSGLTYVTRSALIGSDGGRVPFAVASLLFGVIAIIFLVIAWRTIDIMTLAQQRNRTSGEASIGFFIVVLIIILGIFSYWGRG